MRILKCLTDDEWNAAKKLRLKYFGEQKDPYFGTFDEQNHEHFILYKGTEIIGYAHIQLWPEISKADLQVIETAA